MALYFIDGRLDLPGVGHISRYHQHFGAQGFQFGHRLVVGRRAAPQQRQPRLPLPGEITRQGKPNAAKAAGKQINPLLAQGRRRRRCQSQRLIGFKPAIRASIRDQRVIALLAVGGEKLRADLADETLL